MSEYKIHIWWGSDRTWEHSISRIRLLVNRSQSNSFFGQDQTCSVLKCFAVLRLFVFDDRVMTGDDIISFFRRQSTFSSELWARIWTEYYSARVQCSRSWSQLLHEIRAITVQCQWFPGNTKTYSETSWRRILAVHACQRTYWYVIELVWILFSNRYDVALFLHSSRINTTTLRWVWRRSYWMSVVVKIFWVGSALLEERSAVDRWCYERVSASVGESEDEVSSKYNVAPYKVSVASTLEHIAVGGGLLAFFCVFWHRASTEIGRGRLHSISQWCIERQKARRTWNVGGRVTLRRLLKNTFSFQK